MIAAPNFIDYNGKTLTVHILRGSGTPMVKQPCSRCGGSGNYSFNLADGTMCYGCSGTGSQYVKVSTIQNRIKLADRMDRQRAQNCGLTHSDIKLQTTWLKARVAEKAIYCGLTMVDVYNMIKWLQDRVASQERAIKQTQTDTLDWVGEPKQRLQLNVIVDKIIPIEGYYGTTLMHIMRDESGNKLIWFCSGIPLEKTGEFQVVMATVKNHETREFRGIDEKSTIVTRVKEVK